MAKRIKVRPGKAQSKIGFVVGIGFVIIGVLFVIPTFGPFGIFWTAIAGFIVYSHYKNAYTNEGMPTQEIIIDDDQTDVFGNTYDQTYDGNDIEAKLQKLESLYNKGLITSEEYEEKRKQIIDEF
jgi:hypothetical protein